MAAHFQPEIANLSHHDVGSGSLVPINRSSKGRTAFFRARTGKGGNFGVSPDRHIAAGEAEDHSVIILTPASIFKLSRLCSRRAKHSPPVPSQFEFDFESIASI